MVVPATPAATAKPFIVIVFSPASARRRFALAIALARVKGSVKVDANGVATISHTLRADKATEGDESFSIQVFSDKKIRNLLGQPDAVTVFDTSVKAVKTPKAVAARKDGAPAAIQAAIVNVPGLSSIAGGGGLIHTTSG
jgi:hypothetical protein